MDINSICELDMLLRRGSTPYAAIRSVWLCQLPTEEQQSAHDAAWCRAAWLAGLIFAHKDAAYRRARA
jgi:hypothetical protein